MQLTWTHTLADGRRLEYRLPRWYPWALRLMGLVSTLRARLPDEAQRLRLRERCMQVRVLPDGRWQRWRDFDASPAVADRQPGK